MSEGKKVEVGGGRRRGRGRGREGARVINTQGEAIRVI